MENLLKPERFDVDPVCVGAESKWKHWKRTFSNFLTQVKEATEERKLQLLCNFVSASVYQYINDSQSYDNAINVLDSLYITKRNEIFARHCLASRFQQTGESVNEYLQILKQLSKDCEFKSVTAEENKHEYIRDAFIRGLKNPRIRERLLENASISLEKAYDQARALELAEHHSASYLISSSAPVAAVEQCENKNEDSEQLEVVAPIRSRKCFFCGRDLHLRSICPAKDAICRRCATNATPHERMFIHARRSYNGRSLPTWLTQPGTVLMKNHTRANKYEPIVQEVELIEANPDYACVKLPDGRETNVSIRYLAPRGDTLIHAHDIGLDENQQLSDSFAQQREGLATEASESVSKTVRTSTEEDPQGSDLSCPSRQEDFENTSNDNLHESKSLRPKRQRRQPSYLADYVTY
ncbi:hypothetical protein X975_23396, partial [Stegodyphus mimosarum]